MQRLVTFLLFHIERSKCRQFVCPCHGPRMLAGHAGLCPECGCSYEPLWPEEEA